MKNIAITGAARGIGLELVRQYLADGDRVFAFVRNASHAPADAGCGGRSQGPGHHHRHHPPGWVQTDMGGPQAPLVVEDSVKGCRQVAAHWTLERSGDFIQWTGELQPW